MTETLLYNALLTLQTQLQTISEESGFYYSVQPDAVSLDPNDVVSVVTGRQVKSPFLMLEFPASRVTHGRSDQMLESIPLNVIGFVLADLADPLSRLKSYERLCADVEKAIHANVRLDDQVLDTRLVSKQMIPVPATQRVMALMQFEVRTYRFYGAASG